MDLIKKMLRSKPKDRVDAEEALNHEFFEGMNKEEEIEVDLSHMREFHENIKNGFDEDTNSFVIRENVINGKMDTVNETTSKGGITSFKKMKNGINTQ